MQELNLYIFRSVIRHLNGDFTESKRLISMASKAYKEEEYNRRCICTIGEVIPEKVKEEMWERVC